MPEVARLLVEDVFRLSPPRSFVARGPCQGVFVAGTAAVVVRADGQRVACTISAIYVLNNEAGYLSVGLHGLPDDLQLERGDVVEAVVESSGGAPTR